MNIFNNALPYIGIQWLRELVVLQSQRITSNPFSSRETFPSFDNLH